MSFEIVLLVACDCCEKTETVPISVDANMAAMGAEQFPYTDEAVKQMGWSVNEVKKAGQHDHLCPQCKEIYSH